eukprot:TRINITY_DN106710_c0_g1_i1.p1 TRINITY_DN106710_c0_g1~~TRINITY_DN106710_c0_g1_i1.p1  ORF type:complete len:181 (+),score=42.36 TRINITY_DN106710_c0_g1_i1:68-610(+)
MSADKVLLKVVILGDYGAGKTSLMCQYVKKEFTNTRDMAGANFLTKEIAIADKLVTLQIWDTFGEERLMDVDYSFYRHADCGVLVFDVTDPKSFESLQSWRDKLFENLGSSQSDLDKFPLLVLGNKADAEGERKVGPDEVSRWCELQSNTLYYETSAKEGTNVEQAFEEIAEKTLEAQKP